jgi:hypothetical protein
MATPIHVARIALLPVNPLGAVLDKNTATIAQMTQASTEERVLVDADIPNSVGNPTPTEYLKLEAADDYTLRHIDQTYIITYGQ